MSKSVHAALTAIWLACCMCWPQTLAATDAVVKVIVHPARARSLNTTETRAIYLKQRLFWNDGEPIIPINREAGSEAREMFSERIFGQGSRRLAEYWNRRYFEAGEFPPATLASDEAVVRFVSRNPNAVGYVVAEELGDSVAVVLRLTP